MVLRTKPHVVNLRVSYISAALNFTEAQILKLYRSVIESTRANRIIAYHYKTYGRRSFETIVKEPYLMHQNFLLGKF